MSLLYPVSTFVIIIIITLSQDNIFGTNTSLTFGPQIQRVIIDRNKIIDSMYKADEVSVQRACCERATQPYSLGGRGTIYPGSRPAGVTTRSPRMVTECLITRSMLIYYDLSSKNWYVYWSFICLFALSVCTCLLFPSVRYIGCECCIPAISPQMSHVMRLCAFHPP